MWVPVPGKVQYREEAASGFLFTESAYRPNAVRPWHVHELAEFCFTFAGSMSETCGRLSLTCRRFEVSFKPAGERHKVRVGPNGAHYLTVQVPIARFRDDASLARALEAPRFFPNGPLASLGVRIREELESRDAVTELVLEGTALELIGRAARLPWLHEAARRPPWIATVKDLLHDAFPAQLTIAAIAASAGVHPAHLTSAFRRHVGCTIGEYVRRLRVDHARHLLTATSRSLAEVAIASGFADQSHFTRQFKRLAGMTPRAFRAAYRGIPEPVERDAPPPTP